ncbi:MAG: hypothetical protein QXM86_04110 [Candidatus Bathyarchaeia archaeon]
MANVNEFLFDGIVKLFFAFFVFSVSMILTVSSFVFGNLQYYFACGILWVAASIYILKMALHLRWIRDNIQIEDYGKGFEPLNVDLENVEDALRVCVLYRNGKSLTEIERIMGFSHPYKTKRLLLKGLDLLLKNYMEGEKQNALSSEKNRREASA